MTPAQLATFKTDILAKAGGSFSLPDQGAVSTYYNTSAGAGFYWRKSIPVSELNTAIDWAVFAGFTAVVQNAYFAMIQGGAIDTTSANIRNGFVAVFPNSGSTAATLAALTALAQVVPTRFEALFTASNICALPGPSQVTPTLVAQALL